MDNSAQITADMVEALFRRASGEYLFARWGRPVVPVVFGVEAQTLATVKGAVEAVVGLAGHTMAETDPELGANLMIFFFRDWQELLEVPNLDHLIDGLQDLVARLDDQGASQYRVFRFDKDGAIRACFTFVRMDAALDEVPAEVIALSQAVQMILLWSDTAFTEQSPLAVARGVTVLRPEIAAVIAAAYDPVMPAVADDPSHALRLAARAGLRQEDAAQAVRDLSREVGEADLEDNDGA
ncbi:DUF2927 domain-containing protein [Thioclava pacifica]|uniref:Uncharacterized protein n=1 Tax=Thioclava pacifica DSM 10166 TaxID=1353537 RepID=A0A074JBX8_9RHOB|nr:DUF2927 domain-containing protein [Thioclava pacifica]KEO54064.1 hypothetical protein TP2_03875 [Thioclava pacifica DSM 10166]